MAVILSDDFDRANSTNTVGPSPVGGITPTSSIGTWGINGNQLYSSAVSSSEAMILWDAGTPNVDITVHRTAGTLTNTIRVLFAGVSATDLYQVNFANGSSANVGRRIGTAFFAYSGISIPSTYSLGQQLRVNHKNGVVETFINGVSVGRYQLPVVPTGTLVGIYHTTTADRWNDLTVSDAADIDMEYDAFLYKGRDTASLDAGAIE